ncbi:hypothetical protein [Saccharothrix texasensis]|uniref:ABC-2 family transporter n=1 Tax=Saccharothrix texasensis TaxID=103734 RepID=A0A3N1HC97_9PSEU|nr:hypothetical protein [Saccharothrix texasensis]ROP40135.1 hypothetical protein EDD40_5541 [Saccharothrix texasensis]
MTATATDAVPGAAPATRRARVGWGDLAWLTWRQHRWAIVGLLVAVLLAVVPALGIAWHVDATGRTGELFGRWRLLSVAQVLLLAPMTIGLAVAVFWAAPLLSREYEQRTHLVVWSQDVTPARWLTGKVVLLGVPAVVLSVGLGLASIKLMNSVNAVSSRYLPFGPFEPPAFDVTPLMQAGYSAFGFALGLALSAVTRRTVLSMGLALGSFIAVRGLVMGLWRPYFQDPVRVVEPYDAYQSSWDGPAPDSWTVNSGFADAAGNEIPFPGTCADTQDNAAYVKCMEDSDVRFFTDYHPAERFGAFQLYEFAIFAVLAAALFALAFARVSRTRRV